MPAPESPAWWLVASSAALTHCVSRLGASGCLGLVLHATFSSTVMFSPALPSLVRHFPRLAVRCCVLRSSLPIRVPLSPICCDVPLGGTMANEMEHCMQQVKAEGPRYDACNTALMKNWMSTNEKLSEKQNEKLSEKLSEK